MSDPKKPYRTSNPFVMPYIRTFVRGDADAFFDARKKVLENGGLKGPESADSRAFIETSIRNLLKARVDHMAKASDPAVFDFVAQAQEVYKESDTFFCAYMQNAALHVARTLSHSENNPEFGPDKISDERYKKLFWIIIEAYKNKSLPEQAKSSCRYCAFKYADTAIALGDYRKAQLLSHLGKDMFEMSGRENYVQRQGAISQASLSTFLGRNAAGNLCNALDEFTYLIKCEMPEEEEIDYSG